MSKHIPVVNRDKFEPEEPNWFAIPCCWCVHRWKSDREEPCRMCNHNCNAAQEGAK